MFSNHNDARVFVTRSRKGISMTFLEKALTIDRNDDRTFFFEKAQIANITNHIAVAVSLLFNTFRSQTPFCN